MYKTLFYTWSHDSHRWKVVPNRKKHNYISVNFQRQFGVKMTEDENKKPQVSINTEISLEDIDIPELVQEPEPKEKTI